MGQFQDNHCIFTSLEDYKQNPHSAAPLVAVNMYDLKLTHDLILVRAELSPQHVTKKEAKMLMELMRIYYVNDNQYRRIEEFNHRPGQFDYNAHVREARLLM